MSKYNDDEQIDAEQSSGYVSYFQREVKAKLTGAANVKERSGLDIVAVLDVGRSMKNEDGKNLKKMQSALQFLIKKLTPDDRLSVMTFPRKAERMCPLRWMTASAEAEIGELVDSLKAEQVLEGLLSGKQVLDGRRLIKGRAPVIMLMSDVEDDMNGDDKSVVDLQIPTTDVPIFTYGFGENVNMKLLIDIAKMSNGGTYSYISREEDLNNAISFIPELTKPQSEKNLEIKSSADQKGGVKESTEIVETAKYGAKQVFKIITDAADSQKKSPAAADPDKDVNFKFLGTYGTGLFTKPGMNISLYGTQTETTHTGDAEKKPEIKTASHHGLASVSQNEGVPESTEIVETMKYGAKKVLKFMTDAADAQKKYPVSADLDKDVNGESLGHTYATGLFSTPRMSKFLSGTQPDTPLAGVAENKSEIKIVSHQKDDVQEPNEMIETMKNELTGLLGSIKGRPFELQSNASYDRQRYAATSQDEEVEDDQFAPIVQSIGEHHQKAVEILKQNDNIFDNGKKVQVQDLENIVTNVKNAIQSIQQMQDSEIKRLLQFFKT